MANILFFYLALFLIPFVSEAKRPTRYTELLDYVIEAPDQGDTATCLFVGSTGAMEILLNKKYGLKDQRPGDQFDLSEQFLIFQKAWSYQKSFYESAFLKFNWGEAVHASDLPFSAYTQDGLPSQQVWQYPPGFNKLPKIPVFKVETETLFIKGGKWATNVLTNNDIEKIKNALWESKNPILVNYVDEWYWHVVTIVGYDDEMRGDCYDTDISECRKDLGSFYVRDSFGVKIEVRDYDWFRVKGNAAFIVREAK